MNVWMCRRKHVAGAVAVIAALVVALFFTRLLMQTELDDVHPLIPCEDRLLEESDVLWVVPLYENESIAEHGAWCAAIKGMNKTLGMHGVRHTYEEFKEARDAAYLEQGIQAFETCFGFMPERFKAPQLALSRENAALVREAGFEIHGQWGQLTHKVYHCEDSGRVRNTWIRWF